MERLIEGIQYYEKIRILRETLTPDKAGRLDRQLNRFLHLDWGTVPEAEVSGLVNESRALLRSIE